MTRSFDVFFDLFLNKRLSKHSRRHSAPYDVTAMSWTCWCHDTNTFSTLLESHGPQRIILQNGYWGRALMFFVFVSLNKLSNKQSSCSCFETSWCPWRHCDVILNDFLRTYAVPGSSTEGHISIWVSARRVFDCESLGVKLLRRWEVTGVTVKFSSHD